MQLPFGSAAGGRTAPKAERGWDAGLIGGRERKCRRRTIFRCVEALGRANRSGVRRAGAFRASKGWRHRPESILRTMDLHLTDNQAQLLLAELDRIIENGRYPPHIRALREMRAKLKPSPERPPGGVVGCHSTVIALSATSTLTFTGIDPPFAQGIEQSWRSCDRDDRSRRSVPGTVAVGA